MNTWVSYRISTRPATASSSKIRRSSASIGFDRVFPDDLPSELHPDIMLAGDDDVVARVREATGGAGAHAVFDGVGAPLFEKNLALLRNGGRYAIIASAGDRRAGFDILDYYHKRLTLVGVDTRQHLSREAAATLDRLRPGFDSGALRAPHIVSRLTLEVAIDGYKAVNDGAKGKIVITPH